MGKMENFLGGVRILEEVDSPINGKLMVMSDFAWGTYITAEGLTQSGGVAAKIWKTTLKKIPKCQNCLILGLGGGGNARLVRKFWPKIKITGVEIDPLMVKLGTKYLGLGTSDVDIKIEDAFGFAKKAKKKYDLILVDTYIGDEFPQKFASEEFLKLIKKLLTQKGIAVFNRLYYGGKRPLAMQALKKLERIFPKVEVVYPEANVMFVCSLLE